MAKIDEKEEFFVFVYLDAHTIFSGITEPNGGHIVPKRFLFGLEDGMRWLSKVFGCPDARIAEFDLLFWQSMVLGVVLYEMIDALGLDLHNTVLEVFLTVSSVPAVLDLQRTFVLDSFSFLRLEFQSMWLESGEAVAQFDASTNLDAEIVHQICVMHELLE